MEFAPMIALAVLLYTLVNFLRYLSGHDWSGAVTIAVAWVAGVIVVLLVAQTDFATSIQVGEFTLATLNFWSLLFVGLTIASAGSSFSDTLSSIDRTRSSGKPHLLED